MEQCPIVDILSYNSELLPNKEEPNCLWSLFLLLPLPKTEENNKANENRDKHICLRVFTCTTAKDFFSLAQINIFTHQIDTKYSRTHTHTCAHSFSTILCSNQSTEIEHEQQLSKHLSINIIAHWRLFIYLFEDFVNLKRKNECAGGWFHQLNID